MATSALSGIDRQRDCAARRTPGAATGLQVAWREVDALVQAAAIIRWLLFTVAQQTWVLTTERSRQDALCTRPAVFHPGDRPCVSGGGRCVSGGVGVCA